MLQICGFCSLKIVELKRFWAWKIILLRLGFNKKTPAKLYCMWVSELWPNLYYIRTTERNISNPIYCSILCVICRCSQFWLSAGVDVGQIARRGSRRGETGWTEALPDGTAKLSDQSLGIIVLWGKLPYKSQNKWANERKCVILYDKQFTIFESIEISAEVVTLQIKMTCCWEDKRS